MKQKFTLVLALILLPLLTWSKEYPDRTLGAGFVLGNPSALTAKYWVNSTTAIDASLAFSFSDYMLINSNYLVHFPGLFKTSNPYVNSLLPYLGVGGVFVVAQKDRSSGDGFIGKNSGAFGLGIRVPIGVEWTLSEVPIGIYLEIAPGLALTPATAGFIQGGLGIRYYF